MNIASAELLQNAIQNMGQSFARSRQEAAENAFRESQLENEANRTATDQAFRQAQLAHYNNMEEKQSDMADVQAKKLDAIEKKYGVQAAYQDLQTAQKNITDGMQGMSLDKNLTPEDKTAYLQKSIDGLPDNVKSTVLQNPQISALYNGEGDWDAVAQAVQQQRGKSVTGATDMLLHHYQEAQQKADASGDPADQEYADLLKANLPSTLKTTVPAVAPKPTATKALSYGPDGKLTNSVTSYAMPGAAPAAAAAPSIPTVNSQSDYDALAPGQQYKDSTGRLAVKKSPIPGGGGFQITMPGAPAAPGQ